MNLRFQIFSYQIISIVPFYAGSARILDRVRQRLKIDECQSKCMIMCQICTNMNELLRYMTTSMHTLSTMFSDILMDQPVTIYEHRDFTKDLYNNAENHVQSMHVLSKCIQKYIRKDVTKSIFNRKRMLQNTIFNF